MPAYRNISVHTVQKNNMEAYSVKNASMPQTPKGDDINAENIREQTIR